jgi:hypothetical protein
LRALTEVLKAEVLKAAAARVDDPEMRPWGHALVPADLL